jgi:hypothetical protein
LRILNQQLAKLKKQLELSRNGWQRIFLCLNEEKTEFLLIASKSAHQKLEIPHITIGNEKVTPATEAKNIGYIFDHLMDAKTQISQICKSGWFHLRNIGKIRPYLDTKATETVVHAYITSKLDINNCLLLGLPDSLLRKLKILQNASARLVRRLPKRSHITPTLKELHWLPVPQCIKLKHCS